MSETNRSRPSLEPLVPALVGVGFAHLLGGFVLWTVLPLLVSPGKNDKALEIAKLVWRAPADYLIESTPEEATPAPVVPSAPVLPITPVVASTPPSPGVQTSSLSPNSLARISSTITGMISGRPNNSPARGPMIHLSGQIPLTLPPASPTVTPASPPPAQAPKIVDSPPVIPPAPPAGGRVANKYITLSAVLADKPSLPVPRPNKPVLNLLDIAALNESQRAQDAAAGGADMEPVQKALEKAILREWKAPLIHAVPPSQRRATLLLSVMRDGSIKDAQLQTPSGSQALDDSIRETAAELSKIPETLPSSFPKERYDLRVNFQIE